MIDIIAGKWNTTDFFFKGKHWKVKQKHLSTGYSDETRFVRILTKPLPSQ